MTDPAYYPSDDADQRPQKYAGGIVLEIAACACLAAATYLLILTLLGGCNREPDPKELKKNDSRATHQPAEMGRDGVELSSDEIVRIYAENEPEISKIWIELGEANEGAATMKDAVYEWLRRTGFDPRCPPGETNWNGKPRAYDPHSVPETEL